MYIDTMTQIKTTFKTDFRTTLSSFYLIPRPLRNNNCLMLGLFDSGISTVSF